MKNFSKILSKLEKLLKLTHGRLVWEMYLAKQYIKPGHMLDDMEDVGSIVKTLLGECEQMIISFQTKSNTAKWGLTGSAILKGKFLAPYETLLESPPLGVRVNLNS
jgi:hypothetical protein